MARIRLLHPEQTVDEDVNALSIPARFVWVFLPCHADKAGRLADKPFALRLGILPVDQVDMDALLGELAAKHFIERYEAEGRRWIQIRTFAKHQHPHRNETESKIPPPPTTSGNYPSTTDHGQDSSGNVASRTDHGSSIANPAESEDSRNYPSTTIHGSSLPGGSGSGSGSGESLSGRVRVIPEPGAPPTNTNGVLPLPSHPVPLTGYALQTLFGQIRAEILGGLPWSVPPDPGGKAGAFAAGLGADELADVEPTMRLMLRHIEAEDTGWDDERYRDSVPFAFGSWLSRFTDLREELHGRKPAAAKRAALAQVRYFDPEAQPK